jgi:hypothetical protein
VKKQTLVRHILFFGGLFLLFTNVFGLFTSLRNPEIYNEKNVTFPNDINLTESQVYAVINSDRSDIKAYVTKVTMAVNNGIADYWALDGVEKYNLRVPFQKNYLLFLGSFIWPEKFQRYEFCDYRQAIERGVGMCSQQAIILSEVLYEKGIKTKIVGLSGHVVATTQVDGKTNEWWVLDPDYGVVIPFSIQAIEIDPTIIAPYYSEKGYDTKAITALEDHYGKEGNVISEGYGIGDFSRLTNYFEQVSYVLIWVIPVFLILPFIVLKIRKK